MYAAGTKPNLPYDKRIRVYRYYRVFFRRTEFEALEAARRRVERLSRTEEGRERIREASGFRRLSSTDDLVYNLLYGAWILAKKGYGLARDLFDRTTQSASVALADASLKTENPAAATALEKASKILSADGSRTTRHRASAETVELAVWVNANFARNMARFRRQYGDEFPIQEERARYYDIFAILVVVAEPVAIPPEMRYVKGWYYYEM